MFAVIFFFLLWFLITLNFMIFSEYHVVKQLVEFKKKILIKCFRFIWSAGLDLNSKINTSTLLKCEKSRQEFNMANSIKESNGKTVSALPHTFHFNEQRKTSHFFFHPVKRNPFITSIYINLHHICGKKYFHMNYGRLLTQAHIPSSTQ